MRNGATVLPILVVYTSHSGKIVSEVIDVPISRGSSGAATADTVVTVLDKVLGIRDTALYMSKSGLPLHGKGSQASSQAAGVGSQAFPQAANVGRQVSSQAAGVGSQVPQQGDYITGLHSGTIVCFMLSKFIFT